MLSLLAFGQIVEQQLNLDHEEDKHMHDETTAAVNKQQPRLNHKFTPVMPSYPQNFMVRP